jgi:F0F1-type ATP synthase alpha subunit
LNEVAVDRIAEFELQLRELMNNRYDTVLQSIKTSGKLEESAEESLKAALNELLVQFVKQ